jgi:hypothetical protein
VNRSDARPLASPLAPTRTALEPAPHAVSGGPSDAKQAPSAPAPSSLDRRVSQARLIQLSEQLSRRDRDIIETVGQFRLLQAAQIRRLFFSEITSEAGRARVCRRSLQQLTEHQLLHRLDRRVGGTRAGSSGHVYALSPAARRLLAHWSGAGTASDRGAHEPGTPYAAHTLAIAELYTALVEADRDGQLELLGFETEPARTFPAGFAGTVTLKPDALVRVGAGAWEHVSFCEIDLGTEGRGTLSRKFRAYTDYHRGGREQARHGVFPRVVVIAPTEHRARYLDDLLANLPSVARQLFATATTETAIATLTGTDAKPEPEGAGG